MALPSAIDNTVVSHLLYYFIVLSNIQEQNGTYKTNKTYTTYTVLVYYKVHFLRPEEAMLKIWQ